MSSFVSLISLVLTLLFPLAWVQDNSHASNANITDSVAHLVNAHNNWGAKTSTPNTSLTVKESARSGQIVKLRLYAKGVPNDAVYSIVAWPVTQKRPVEAMTGVTIDASGLAICAGTPGTCSGDKPNDPIDLAFQPVAGEPVRIGLVSVDGTTRVFAKTVLIPLRGEDRGCAVEAILLTPGAELVLIEGSGFPADSKLVVDTDSEGERHRQKVNADGDGRYTTAVLPYKRGTVRGTLNVRLNSTECSPSLSVPWGPRN